MVVTLEEGNADEQVLCTAEAYPEASYTWERDGEVVATDNLLFFDRGVDREQGGEYVCVARNRHGVAETATRIEVLFRPDCAIAQEDDDGDILLTCEARANPEEVAFSWQRVGGNETATLSDDLYTVDGLKSVLRLDSSADSFGTYYCHVSNSMGKGTPCDMDVQGMEFHFRIKRDIKVRTCHCFQASAF